MNKWMILFALLLTFSACSDSGDSQDEIDAFIAANNLQDDVQEKDGIYYVIYDPGSEEKPKIDDFVTVEYRGFYTDGVEFDNSENYSTDVEINLLGTIRGWRIGIPLFGKGGSGLLIIPPEYGYGEDPSEQSGIRKNAVLVFEIELIDFE